MGETKVDAESQLHGTNLSSPSREQPANTDMRIRLDGEADTLYEDTLDLEDDSRPLTGINGRDDSVKP